MLTTILFGLLTVFALLVGIGWSINLGLWFIDRCLDGWKPRPKRPWWEMQP